MVWRVCIAVCLPVCVSVQLQDNSNNNSKHLKLEHIVVYGVHPYWALSDQIHERDFEIILH